MACKATNSMPQDEEKSVGGLRTRNLRFVVIDGENVAQRYDHHTKYNWKGVAVAINYFLEHGHKVVAVVPHWAQGEVQDTPELGGLRENIEYSPHRPVGDNTVESNYDDSLVVLETARKRDGIVLTNQSLMSQYKARAEFRDVIANKLLPYCFVVGKLILPLDPLGEKGPTLEKFLQQDTDLRIVQAEFTRTMPPSEIGFTTQGEIGDTFDDGKRLEETFREMLVKGNAHEWMPPIDCVKHPDGGYYVQYGNRRLYLLKVLAEEDPAREIEVNVMLFDPEQFPSENKQTGLSEMSVSLYNKLKQIQREHKNSATPGDDIKA